MAQEADATFKAFNATHPDVEIVGNWVEGAALGARLAGAGGGIRTPGMRITNPPLYR